MIQSEEYVVKLTAGQSTSIAALEAADTGHTYNIHTMIILGSYNDNVDLTLNGNVIKLAGGFVYNQTPIRSIVLTTSTNGVLLIGKKTKKVLFNF
jgi:hypothetical protein